MVDGVVPADREGLKAARSAASALGSVVAELNDLASAEAAPLQARPVAVDLAAAVHEVVLALDGLRRQLDVRIEASIPDGTTVRSDPVHLERVLRNVIGNGLNHSPAGARLTVAATTADATVSIRVGDQGAGIAAEDVAHVFERFYRADPARPGEDPRTGRRSGTGIGLTITRELLTANGGRIEVERTGPDGTTFLIELPRD